MKAEEYKRAIEEMNAKAIAELKAMNWQSRALNKFNKTKAIVEFAVLNHPNTKYSFDKDLCIPIYELSLAERVDVMGFGTVDRLLCSDKGSYLSVGGRNGIARLKEVCSYEELNEIVAILMDELNNM